MKEHLAKISRRVAPNAHAVVTLDRAGWHLPGGKLRVPENISLLPLPPYSPELNPVENIWQFLRQNYLSNRVHETYDGHRRRLPQRLERTHRRPSTHHLRATREWAAIKE